MLSRSKSAQGLRVLGSNVGSTGHQDTEMEYTFIKGLVEAYSQQCMPASYKKIPLRADKWAPVRETGPRYRLDLSSVSLTPRWATSSFSRLQDARAKDRRNGHRRETKGYGASGTGEPKPRTSRNRPVSPIRNTFQRSFTTVEEKVLPVWTPELKEGIVFSHRYPSTSSLANTNTSADENGHVLSKGTPGESRCQSRSASPSRISPPQPKVHQPFTTKREQIRPKTVGATHRKSLNLNVKATDDTALWCSTDKQLRAEQNAIEGLTKMTQDQQTQTLSLDVFLPREVDGGSFAYPKLQASRSTGTKGELRADRDGELFSNGSQLLSNGNKQSKHCNDANQERIDDNAVSPNDSTLSSHVCCPRYKNTIGKLWGSSTKSNCKKWIHCELFGPVLCSDCRLEREKLYNATNNSISNLEDDFSMPTLSLRGRKPVLSPRN